MTVNHGVRGSSPLPRARARIEFIGKYAEVMELADNNDLESLA